jgi:hypothetical protein
MLLLQQLLLCMVLLPVVLPCHAYCSSSGIQQRKSGNAV